MALVRNVMEKSGKNVIFITKPGKVREFRILRSFQIPVKIRKVKHQRTLNFKYYAKSKFHFHPWFHLFLIIVQYKKSQKSVGCQIWSKNEDWEWSWQSTSCQGYTLAFQVLRISCFIEGKSFFINYSLKWCSLSFLLILFAKSKRDFVAAIFYHSLSNNVYNPEISKFIY